MHSVASCAQQRSVEDRRGNGVSVVDVLKILVAAVEALRESKKMWRKKLTVFHSQSPRTHLSCRREFSLPRS
jgi:hypothetical protein